MNNLIDFFRYWQSKYSKLVKNTLNRKLADKVLEGINELNEESSQKEITNWVRNSIEVLSNNVSQENMIHIMSACSCEYPLQELAELKNLYKTNKNIDQVHQKLEQKFRDFLADSLKLDSDTIDKIIRKGWGLAGKRIGNRIIATKIPKSGYLKQYLAASDSTRKKEYYCHCPLVRDLVISGKSLPELYCYCGAGFYKRIWEEITQNPVKIKLIKSIFKGDEICQVEIILADKN